ENQSEGICAVNERASKYYLKNVVDLFLKTVNGVKSDTETREVASVIECYYHILLPTEGITSSESLRFMNGVFNLLETTQRSVMKRSVCRLLDGVCQEGLGRGNSTGGIILGQLEQIYGKLIDLMRHWKSTKVNINVTCGHLGAQTDGLFSISVIPALTQNYTLLLNQKDQQKRIKALEVIAEYINGVLDVLPLTHQAIPQLLNDFFNKTLMTKKEYQHLKFASTLETQYFEQVFTHNVVYTQQVMLDILSGKLNIPTDIRAMAVKNVPLTLVLPADAQAGISEFLSQTPSLVGTVMDPTNLWVIEMYPDSYSHDATTRDSVSHKLVDASRSPILEIKMSARRALERDAIKNPRLFCGIFEEFLRNSAEDESDLVDGEYIAKVSELFGKTSEVGSREIANMLNRRILRLLLTMSEDSVSVAGKIKDTLTLKGYSNVKEAQLIGDSLSRLSSDILDHFVLQHCEETFVRELYSKLLSTYTIKSPNEIVKFLFLSTKGDHPVLVQNVISQYFDGVPFITQMVTTLLSKTNEKVIDMFAQYMMEKKKKLNFDLLATIVNVTPKKYEGMPHVIALCRAVMSNWIAFKDIPNSQVVLMEISAKIYTLEMTLSTPLVPDGLCTFVGKYINQPSLHKNIIEIMKAIASKATLSSPVTVFNLLEALYASDPSQCNKLLVELLKRYPDMLTSSMQRCFVSREVREMYFYSVYTIITNNSQKLPIEQILSFSVVLAAKSSLNFSALMKGVQSFGIDLFSGFPAWSSWEYIVSEAMANRYKKESSLVLKGVLQYHTYLSTSEYSTLLRCCRQWILNGIEIDFESVITSVIDMAFFAQQLDSEFLDTWRAIGEKCSTSGDALIELVIKRGGLSEQSTLIASKILSQLCSVSSMRALIFRKVQFGLVDIIHIEEIKKEPSKEENMYFVIMSYIISLMPLSVKKDLTRILLITLIYYSPTCVASNYESSARRVLSVVMPQIEPDLYFKKEGYLGVRSLLNSYSLFVEFEEELVSVAKNGPTEVSERCSLVYSLIGGSDQCVEKNVSSLLIRGLLMGEASIVRNVVSLVATSQLKSVSEAIISLPDLSIFSALYSLVNVQSISIDTLSRAAGNTKLCERVLQMTLNCSGLRGVICELIDFGMKRSRRNFSGSVMGGCNEFSGQEIVNILEAMGESDTSNVSIEAILELSQMNFGRLDERVVRVLSKGMNLEETADECAKFFVKYQIETFITQENEERKKFGGAEEKIFDAERVKAIEKLSQITKEKIDVAKITMTVKQYHFK
ncbi:hypothetical protein EIN_497700, partial [Entamoeba invadens IP1]